MTFQQYVSSVLDLYNKVTGYDILTYKFVGNNAVVTVDYNKHNTSIHRRLELLSYSLPDRYPGCSISVGAKDDEYWEDLQGDKPPGWVVATKPKN